MGRRWGSRRSWTSSHTVSATTEKPWGRFKQARGVIIFYNNNTTDDFISSRDAGMYTGYVVESILAFHPSVLISESVGVMWVSTSLPGTTIGNKLQVSWPPGYLFSLQVNSICPYLGHVERVRRLAWLTGYQKDSLPLRVPKHFYITHMIKQVREMHCFSTLLKKSTHKRCLGVNSKSQCSLSNIYHRSTVRQASYYRTQGRGQCCAAWRVHSWAQGQPFINCQASCFWVLHCITLGPSSLYSSCQLVPASQIYSQESYSFL